MGPCCVEGCEVTSEETYYFEFPTSRLLRRKWLEVIPIPGKLPLGTVVCSRHFSSHDYENIRGKVRLKRKVVPSLLLQDTKATTPSAKSPKSPKSTESPKPPKPPESPKSLKSPTSPKQLKSPTSPESPKSPKSPESLSAPKSPPKELEICDSTTASVPSPVDAEKMIDDIQKERRASKLLKVAASAGEVSEALEIENGWSGEGDRAKAKKPQPALPDPKEDIEDMITNYHIKNKVPNPALLADLVPPADLTPSAAVPQQSQHLTIDLEEVKEADPVFIEISVDKDTNAAGAGSQDCLMLLESVQVEVDPTTLMLDQDDYEPEEEKAPDKKSDPISLLTSSDEDDVIIQEPHIDTVDVSDETDEDDVPLVKLVKKKKTTKKKQSKNKDKSHDGLNKLMWGMYDFYCMKCHFTTTSSAEYNKHVSEHSKSTVLQVCPICGFTSASKTRFSIHKRIHKVEKKFKCHLCDYWARHKMSLVYHLKNHDAHRGKPVKLQDLKCWKCGFKSDVKSAIMDHIRICCPGDKRHKCDKCEFSAKKKCYLQRHMRKHQEDGDCIIESVGFKPEVEVVDVSECSVGGKRHKCDKCDYSSERRSDVKRHRLRRHREDDDVDDCVLED